MKSYLKYGLYFAAISIVFSLLTYGLGLDMKPIGQKLNWVYYLILLVVLVIGIKYRKEQELNGYITFGQAFKFGMAVTLIGSLVSAVYTYLYASVINPEISEYIMNLQEEKMVEEGLPESQIEMSLNMMEKFMSPAGMMLFGLIGTLFFGCILVLIVSAIFKGESESIRCCV